MFVVTQIFNKNTYNKKLLIFPGNSYELFKMFLNELNELNCLNI